MTEWITIFALLIADGWLLFIVGGSCIIATYMIWQMLKSIYKGDFL